MTSLTLSALVDIERAVSLVQQISWAVVALSLSPFWGKPATGLMIPTYTRSSEGMVNLHFTVKYQQIDEPDPTCWLQLFNEPVLASHFPIPSRNDEIGLEMPLEFMAQLCEANHVVEFGGGLVIKGFTAMLLHTSIKGGLVQWHLVANEGAHLSYRDGVSKCPSRALLDQVSLEDLRSTRAILGWCKFAEINLGKSDCTYLINYSECEKSGRSLIVSDLNFGSSQFIAAHVKLKLGSKSPEKLYYPLTGHYEQIINMASRIPVLLYDAGDRRAWLVAATNVLLHMAQHRLLQRDDCVSGIKFTNSASETLKRQAKTRLSDIDSDIFENVVSDVWSRLEHLRETTVSRYNSSDHEVHTPNTIFGFDYITIVEQGLPHLMKTTIKDSSGGWLKLAQDIDAITLFARGLKDIIKPASMERAQVCHSWSYLPLGCDYLAASIETLAASAVTATEFKLQRDILRYPLEGVYLTRMKRLRWHKGNSLVFGECITSGSDREATCRCCRLQRVEPHFFGNFVSPGSFLLMDILKGAVIFGAT